MIGDEEDLRQQHAIVGRHAFAQAAAKTERLNVTSASARALSAVSSTILSFASRNCGRREKWMSIVSQHAAAMSSRLSISCRLSPVSFSNSARFRVASYAAQASVVEAGVRGDRGPRDRERETPLARPASRLQAGNFLRLLFFVFPASAVIPIDSRPPWHNGATC